MGAASSHEVFVLADPTAARATRPRDAASLVVVRQRRGRPEVLLGRREPRDRFMPGVYVFPGGRVDPSDGVAPAAAELRPAVAKRLAGAASAAQARALAVAALRETYEETGLVVGTLSGGVLRPNLRPLEFVARAITPAGSPIRYHARFFFLGAEHVEGRLRSNGELLDLAWIPLARTSELPMIDVTQFVLREVGERLRGRAKREIPLVHYRQNQRLIRR